MKITFIGKRFYTNRDALHEQYGRIFQLPFHWAKKGAEVDSWLIDYHSNECFSDLIDGVRVLSSPIKKSKFLSSLSERLLRSKLKSDIIVASGDCYIGLIGYLIARRQGAKFVFDVYDKYDEFGGYFSPPKFDLFRFLLHRADLRLFASRALMQDLSPCQNYDQLVPNGVDVRRFVPKDKKLSREELGLPQTTLLVGYFGGMELDRGISDLITAISQLRNKGIAVELLLGGKLPTELNINNPGVRYLGNIPYDRMPTILGCCDLLAVPYRRSIFMDAGASNKIAEAIACQRPLIATRTPNLIANFPIQAERLGGLLAEPGNADDIARVIQEQSERKILVEMPQAMGWDDISNRVLDKLKKLVCH